MQYWRTTFLGTLCSAWHSGSKAEVAIAVAVPVGAAISIPVPVRTARSLGARPRLHEACHVIVVIVVVPDAFGMMRTVPALAGTARISILTRASDVQNMVGDGCRKMKKSLNTV